MTKRSWDYLEQSMRIILLTGILVSSSSAAPGDKIVAGQLIDSHTDAVKELTSVQLLTVTNWLSRQNNRWHNDFITRPPPQLIVSLDTLIKPKTFRLLIWTGPTGNVVVLEQPEGNPKGFQVFSTEELNMLLQSE